MRKLLALLIHWFCCATVTAIVGCTLGAVVIGAIKDEPGARIVVGAATGGLLVFGAVCAWAWARAELGK